MGGRRRCCCEVCLIFEDDFNRADSTTVAGWTELAGDSEIIGNELSLPTLAVIREDIAHPHKSQTGVVFVDLIDAQDGNKWEVRVGCDINGLQGDVVRVEVGPNDITFSVNGGTPNTLVNYTPGEDNTLQICRNIEGIYATLKSTSTVWACTSTDNQTIDRYVALVNWGTNTVLFDNFFYWQQRHTLSICNPCGCSCGDYCISKNLTLTFVATGDCTILDGEEITLNYVPFVADPCVWNGSRELSDCDGNLKDWEFTFMHNGGCDAGGVDGFVLCLITIDAVDSGWEGTGWCGVATWSSFSDACVCEPFEVKFGNFQRSHSGGLLGNYDLVITE